MLPRKPLFELLSGPLSTSPEEVPELWFQEALLSLWSRAHVYLRDTAHCNYRGKVTCVPGVCVTLQIPPTLAQKNVICQQWTQNPNCACRDQSTQSNLFWLRAHSSDTHWTFLGIFPGSDYVQLWAQIRGRDTKLMLLRIILLDLPGNISPNKILLNTSRIIKLPATLQKMFSAVGYWFQTGGKGFTAAERRLKRCSYLYHPGRNADLGEFVLLRVMVTLFHPNRDTLSGQRVSSPSRLLKVTAANVFPIT